MNKLKGFIKDCLDIKPSLQRKLIIAIVFFTNAVDNLLLTCVVPIVPEILVIVDKKIFIDNLQSSNHSGSSLLHTTLNTTRNIQKDKGYPPTFFISPSDNSKVGWILATKALVQLLANPLAGYLANRYGNGVVMLGGTVILGLSSFIYTVSKSLPWFVVARGIHGLGSGAAFIGGLSLIAEKYSDDCERSKAMGKALAGIAFGVVLGYPYGGFLFGYVSRHIPFLIICGFVIIDIVFIMFIVKPVIQTKNIQKLKNSKEGTSLIVMLRDPYIMATACILMFSTMGISIIETTVPMWILETMDAKQWELAIVFLPDSIGYLIGTYFFATFTLKVGRWRCTLVGMMIIGLSLFMIPFATQVPHLIGPHLALGLSLGIADVSVVPLMALLVDTRHTAVYGSVYAVDQLSVCIAYGLGPVIAGEFVRLIGFSWYMRGFGVLIACLSTISFYLQDYKVDEEKRPILEDSDSMQLSN